MSAMSEEKEMATHSSVPAWRIPETAEPGGLPSVGSHRVGYDCSDLAAAAAAMSEGNSDTRGGVYLWILPQTNMTLFSSKHNSFEMTSFFLSPAQYKFLT